MSWPLFWQYQAFDDHKIGSLERIAKHELADIAWNFAMRLNDDTPEWASAQILDELERVRLERKRVSL